MKRLLVHASVDNITGSIAFYSGMFAGLPPKRRKTGYLTDHLHSKSWDEFARPDAPHIKQISARIQVFVLDKPTIQQQVRKIGDPSVVAI